MSQQHPLEDLFLHAAYRVRLARGGHATIRVGEALPAELAAMLPDPDTAWGFITAWNPRGEARDRTANRMAQRALRDLLRKAHPDARIHPGVGTLGTWREPSLFVAGIGAASLDELMLRFGQLAVVLGRGGEPAALRWSPAGDRRA